MYFQFGMRSSALRITLCVSLHHFLFYQHMHRKLAEIAILNFTSLLTDAGLYQAARLTNLFSHFCFRILRMLDSRFRRHRAAKTCYEMLGLCHCWYWYLCFGVLNRRYGIQFYNFLLFESFRYIFRVFFAWLRLCVLPIFAPRHFVLDTFSLW